MRIDNLHPAERAARTLELPVAMPDSSLPTAGNPSPVNGKSLPPQESDVASAVHAAAERIEQYLRSSGRELSFSVDDATGELVVRVRDPATGDLIRQLPSEETLRIARTLETSGPALVREFA